MICDFSLKEFTLTANQEHTLQKKLISLKRKLTHITPDVIKLSVVIKKHQKNAFYSGTYTLHLFGRSFAAKVGGHSVEEVIAKGFAKIEEEFVTYKGKHFKGDSTYPKRDSIRMAHV